MRKILLVSLLVCFSAVAEEELSSEVKQQKQEEREEDFFMPHEDLDPENWQSMYEKMEQQEDLRVKDSHID